MKRYRTENKTTKRVFSLILALIMVCAVISPVFAREYYNYECRYTINLSEEAYSKMSKVNENLMSIILGDGVSVTFSATNYYEHLSESERDPELTIDDYSVGGEVFSATYNDATYMKDDYFTKRLSNVSGVTEMTGVTLVNINGFDFWEMSYDYFGDPSEVAEEEGEEGKDEEKKEDEKKEENKEDKKEEDKQDQNAEDTAEGAEGENAEGENAEGEEEKEREDGLVKVGEGKMYFTVYKGYSYSVHMICKQGKIADHPEMQEMFTSINLGLKQSNLMKIMWITIGVLCTVLLVLIILVLRLKSPKKLAKLRAQAGLDENGKYIGQTLAIEGEVEFDEQEQLRNNEMVNAKLEKIANGEDSDEKINEFLDEQLEDAEVVELSVDEEK